MVDFLRELNPQQYAGVVTTEGPVLVLAGAGSGKTRMLTYKVAYMVYEFGVDPFSILAVTFTNKAAREMVDRVQQLLKMDMKKSWVGTFHSLCGKILRSVGDVIDIPPDYIVYDQSDSIQLVKAIICDFDLNPKTIDPKKVHNGISSLKRRLIFPEDFGNRVSNPGEKTLSKIYDRYVELLRRAKAVDFDDMISSVVQIFRKSKTAREKYANRFNYILVDEFQDTNEAQFAFLRELTIKHHNITVVGDDDQSIYSWRGAQLRNILDFPEYYQNVKIIKLEENYRSTGNILRAAGKLISNNRMRHKKKLFTNAPKGEKVMLVKFANDLSEANYVVEQISERINNGEKAGDIAVLYRINALSRLFEQEFSSRDIPYIVVGGVGFYERAEIKDIIAYVRLLINPDDDLALKRIINNPRRGIGLNTMEKIEELAKSANKSMYKIISNDKQLPLRLKRIQALSKFVEMIEKFKLNINDIKPSELIQELLEETGYLRMILEDDSIQSRTRMENLGQLITAAQEFESKDDEPTALNFLNSITLMTDIDRWHRGDDVVNLMTVHAAKGLEFETVFIVGLELGIFPLIRALDKEDQLEEERRLFYVALTRAKHNAFVSYAKQRARFGTVEELGKSLFVDELSKDAIQFIDLAPESSITLGYDFAKSRGIKITQTYNDTVPKIAYKLNKMVFHPFFGKGKIIDVRGKGGDTVVTVDFPKVGVKKLVARYAKLKLM